MKKFLFLAMFVLSFFHTAFADDLLASITNGAVSDNSPGIKVLSDVEASKVKGGMIYFARSPQDDFYAGLLTTRAYLVGDDRPEYNNDQRARNVSVDYLSYTPSYIDNVQNKLGLDEHERVTIVSRLFNGQKEYYLKTYNNLTGRRGVIFGDSMTLTGKYATKIINNFRRIN